MRLLYFDITQGNSIGARYIFRKFGVAKGAMILTKLKWRETFDNPFTSINEQNRPTRKQRLSQRQMAPLVIFYQVLQDYGYTKEEALNYSRDLSRQVALAFLKFNIPQLRRSGMEGRSPARKRLMLKRLTDRFFNAESDTEILDDGELRIDVHTCYFASYTRALGVPELGPLFCETDQFYFDHFQEEVDFNRTQTLAIEGKPCDFRFKWKEG
jgi:hypothetical protein